jgi:hypothetical protein
MQGNKGGGGGGGNSPGLLVGQAGLRAGNGPINNRATCKQLHTGLGMNRAVAVLTLFTKV